MMRLILVFAWLFPMVAFAFMCPNNFNQIDFGMTVDQVEAQCGKPTATKESVREPDDQPQEWTYYIPQTVPLNTQTQGNGTLKTSFAFDNKGTAVNITVNGIGVGATTICGQNLGLGATRDAVKAACGNPSFINKQNAPGTSVVGESSRQDIKVMENSYGSTTLIFENGVLKSKR